jgi:Regulator of ribonuclease activity B
MWLIKRFAVAIGLLSVVVSDVNAGNLPEGNWIGYNRIANSGVWITLFDQAIPSFDQSISYSCYQIEYRFLPNQLTNGVMPVSDMADVYYGLEDKISDQIGKLGGRIAASQTGFGVRRVWFCAVSSKLEDVVKSVVEKFSQIPLEHGPANFTELLELKPTQVEGQLAGDQTILINMAKEGDDGSKERQVMYWIREFKAADRESIGSSLTKMGYVIEDSTAESIQFSRTTSLTFESANAETLKLVEFCKKFDCNYDGWETPIVKPTLQ